MAFWIRTNQSKLIFLSKQLKIYYLQIPYDSSLKYTATSSRSRVLENPVCDFIKKHSEFCTNVRFFAAPVQVISGFLRFLLFLSGFSVIEQF
jgi:translation initiation factor IF-3